MNFDYTDEQKTIRQEVIDFCRTGLDEGAGPSIESAFAGRGFDQLTTIVALEAFGYACEDSELLAAAGASLPADTSESAGQKEHWERIGQAAIAVGELQRGTENAIKSARKSKQSGQESGNHERVSNGIADMKVRLEISRLLVYRAATKLGRDRDALIDAAIAKLAVTKDGAEEGTLRDAIAQSLGL
jgi:hypothetical protein